MLWALRYIRGNAPHLDLLHEGPRCVSKTLIFGGDQLELMKTRIEAWAESAKELAPPTFRYEGYTYSAV